MVSIIIPVYNVEKYLKECVESALNQTYNNLEIILVDDGSSDCSFSMCNNFCKIDNRIVIIHIKNSGLSAARNTGFSMSTGEYIYFLDSDDYIANTAIEALYNHIIKERADFVFFDAINFADEDFPNTSINRNYYIRKHEYVTCESYRMLGELDDLGEYRACAPLHFINRSYITENKISFYNGIIHEDELYSFYIYMNDSIASHLSKALYYRRNRANSTMTAQVTYKNLLGYFVVIIESLKFINALNNFEKFKIGENHIKKLYISALRKYYSLDLRERKKVEFYKQKIDCLLKKQKYLHSFDVFLIRKSYFLYCIFKEIQKIILLILRIFSQSSQNKF